jgi:hypothetical protein
VRSPLRSMIRPTPLVMCTGGSELSLRWGQRRERERTGGSSPGNVVSLADGPDRPVARIEDWRNIDVAGRKRRCVHNGKGRGSQEREEGEFHVREVSLDDHSQWKLKPTLRGWRGSGFLGLYIADAEGHQSPCCVIP